MSTQQRTSADGQLTGSFPEFLAFQWFITPWVIQVLFWMQAAGVVLGTVVGLLSGLRMLLNGEVLYGLGAISAAMASLVFGLIFARIFCELLILTFKAYDRLGEISRKLDR